MKQSTILTCLTLTIALAACGPNEGAEEWSPPTADAESDSGPTETSLEGSTETGGASETGPEPEPDPEPAELCCSCADRACDVVTLGTCTERGVAWQVCDLGSDGACLDACGVCCECDTLHWRDPLCEPATAGICTGADNPGLVWCQPDAYGTLDDCRAACRVR